MSIFSKLRDAKREVYVRIACTGLAVTSGLAGTAFLYQNREIVKDMFVQEMTRSRSNYETCVEKTGDPQQCAPPIARLINKAIYAAGKLVFPVEQGKRHSPHP